MRTFWLILGACWIAFLVCFWAVTRAFRSAEASRIRGRLLGQTVEKAGKSSAQAPSLISAEDGQTGRLILRLLARFELKSRLQVLLDQADLKWHPGRVLHACLALFLCAFAAVWYGAAVVRKLAIPAGLLAGSLPILYVLRRRTARLRKFEEQFPESLEFVSRSMRAGHAFSVSLEMLHKEFQEPLAGEFRRTFDEHNLGMPLESALQRLGKRVPLMDVQFFVSAVLLQKRTGGNLAELLDKLAYVIRERFKLRGTDQGRQRARPHDRHGAEPDSAVGGRDDVLRQPRVRHVLFHRRNRAHDGRGGRRLQLVGYGVIRKIVSIEV